MKINIPDDDILAQLENLQRDAEEFQRVRSANRVKWLNAYEQKPYGNEEEGWSQVVSSAIWDAVNGLTPNLLERFTGDWFKLKGKNQEKAALNQQLVKYQLYQQNRFERILDHDYLYDVLNTEMAVLKAYYTEEFREGKQTIPRMSTEEIQALQNNENVKIISATPVEEFNVNRPYWSGYENIKIIVKEDHFKGFKVESVPGSEFYISSDAKDVETARLVEHRVTKSLDYVKKMERRGVYRKGVCELIELGIEEEITAEEDDNRRTTHDDNLFGVDTSSPFVKPNAPVEITESYLRLDLEGSGVLEPVVVTSSGSVILSIQQNFYIRPPFFITVGFPRPHRIDGTALGEILEHEQKEQTTLRRLMIDGVAQEMHKNPVTDDPQALLALKNRTPKDALNISPNKVGYLESPTVGMGIFKAMEHGQNAIEEKTPYSRMAQGSTDAGNALNKTASGMNMVLTSAARKERQLARRIARTFEDVIRFCLWINEKIGPPINYDQIIGMDKQLTPQDLFKDGEFEIEVVVGLGPQDKIEAAQILDQYIQFGVQAGMQLGTTTPEHIVKAIKKKHALLDVPIEGMIAEEGQIQQSTVQIQQQMKQMQEGIQQLQAELQKTNKALTDEKTKGQLQQIEHQAEVKILQTQHKLERENDRAIRATAN